MNITGLILTAIIMYILGCLSGIVIMCLLIAGKEEENARVYRENEF